MLVSGLRAAPEEIDSDTLSYRLQYEAMQNYCSSKNVKNFTILSYCPAFSPYCPTSVDIGPCLETWKSSLRCLISDVTKTKVCSVSRVFWQINDVLLFCWLFFIPLISCIMKCWNISLKSVIYISALGSNALFYFFTVSTCKTTYRYRNKLKKKRFFFVFFKLKSKDDEVFKCKN